MHELSIKSQNFNVNISMLEGILKKTACDEKVLSRLLSHHGKGISRANAGSVQQKKHTGFYCDRCGKIRDKGYLGIQKAFLALLMFPQHTGLQACLHQYVLPNITHRHNTIIHHTLWNTPCQKLHIQLQETSSCC
jgi:hypothetical protein